MQKEVSCRVEVWEGEKEGGGEGREKGSKGEKSIEQCLRDTDGSEQWKS